ncbi:hypothetical protein V6Z11_D10G124800 [Gossypium hirsutum]
MGTDAIEVGETPIDSYPSSFEQVLKALEIQFLPYKL